MLETGKSGLRLRLRSTDRVENETIRPLSAVLFLSVLTSVVRPLDTRLMMMFVRELHVDLVRTDQTKPHTPRTVSVI